MTRHPCGCGIAWLATGGPQEPANTRAPPVFRRLSANERPGWLLCEMHRRLTALATEIAAMPASEFHRHVAAAVWAGLGLHLAA